MDKKHYSIKTAAAGALGILIMLVMIPSFASGAASSNANGALSIMNLHVTPEPAIAGSNIAMSFNLFNSFTDSLTNVDLALVSTNSIINVSPAYSYLASSIGEGMFNGFTNQFFYKLHLPSNLKEGIYEIDVTATYQTTQSGQNVAGSSTMPIYIYVYGSPNIAVEAAPQQDITPGEPFSAVVSVVNSGTGTAYNTTLTIDSSGDFIPVGQERFSLGDIGQTTVSEDAMLESMQEITNGTHYVNFTISYSTGTAANITENLSTPINIVINRPDIIFSLQGAQPSELYPGANQTVTLAVENTGTGTAKDISVDVLGNSYIYPSSSATNFFIGSLSAGSSTTETFTINANRSIENAPVLPVYTRYYSSNYQLAYNTTQNVSVSVQPSALFNVSETYGNAYLGAAYEPVTFTIENVGNEPADGITFTMQSIYPISPVNSNAYVNELGPGNSTNVTFYVSVDSKGTAGQYPVTIYEQWRQPNGNTNQQYYSSTAYYVQVNKNSSTGDGYVGTIVPIVVVVVIVIVGYRFYRRRKAKSQKNKKKLDK